MSEPTLLEDLEESARHLDAHGRTTLAARLRAAATRLREALVHAERQCGDGRGCTCCVDALAALRAVNGGSSPPITPGSPGGGTTRLTCEEYRVEYGTSKGSHCPACDPASPPTAPTCTCIPGSKGEPHAYWCPAETTCASCGRPLQPPGKIQCCSSPLHRTTPTCASWCGTTRAVATSSCAAFWAGDDMAATGPGYCSAACRDARRPLHPRTP